MAKKLYIGYRYIPPEEMNTPMMHLPIQRTILNAEAPYTEHEVKLALMRDYPNWFKYDYLRIEDIQGA